MTTASRVSDSRVTDEMVDAGLSAWLGRAINEECVQIFSQPMRAALEAALACQGPVVRVSDLEALRDEVRAQAILKDDYAEWEETHRMFTDIIAKANGHE